MWAHIASPRSAFLGDLLMAQTEAQLRASKKYHQKLDEVKVRVPAGERQIIADYAASRGESVNGFIRRAIKETMERDRAGDAEK